MERELLSYCRICAAACGIAVTVDGEQVVRGARRRRPPGLARLHVLEGPRTRRVAPQRRRGSTARGSGAARSRWDEALDDLAAVVRDTVDGAGTPTRSRSTSPPAWPTTPPDRSPPARSSARSGARSFYTAVTVDNAPVLVAAELVTGNAMMNPLWDPTTAGLLLLVGTNPVVSHGYGTTLPDPVNYLRDYRRGGGRMWVLDPRRTESAALADEHLATRPGTDVVVLAALARELLEHGADDDELRDYCAPDDVAALGAALGPFTVARAASAAGIDADALIEPGRRPPRPPGTGRGLVRHRSR